MSKIKNKELKQSKCIESKITTEKNEKEKTATFGKPVIIGLPPKMKQDSNKKDEKINLTENQKSRNSKAKELKNNLSKAKDSKTTNYSTFTSLKKTENENKVDYNNDKVHKIDDQVNKNPISTVNSRNKSNIKHSYSEVKNNAEDNKVKSQTIVLSINKKNDYSSTYNKIVGEIVKDLRIKFEQIIVDKNYPNYRIREDVMRYLNNHKELTPSWGNLSTLFTKCQDEFKRRISKYNSKPSNIIEMKKIHKLIESNSNLNERSSLNINNSKLMKNILDHDNLKNCQEKIKKQVKNINEKEVTSSKIPKSNVEIIPEHASHLAILPSKCINSNEIIKDSNCDEIELKNINEKSNNNINPIINENNISTNTILIENKTKNILSNKEKIYENLLKIKLEKEKKLFELTKKVENDYVTGNNELQYSQTQNVLNLYNFSKEKLKNELDHQVKAKKEMLKMLNNKKKDEELRIVKRIEEDIDRNIKKNTELKMKKKTQLLEFLEISKKERNDSLKKQSEANTKLQKDYVSTILPSEDNNDKLFKQQMINKKQADLKKYLEQQVKEKHDKQSNENLNEKFEYKKLLNSANQEKEEHKRSQSTKKQRQLSYKNQLDNQVDENKYFKKFNII